MHRYRTHTCGELRRSHADSAARLAGWIHRKRDHGGILFIDLRDHYGITQVVIPGTHPAFEQATHAPRESVIGVAGQVASRPPEAVNATLPTGEIELHVDTFELLNSADHVPFYPAEDTEVPETTRLKYRFVDLRRPRLHRNIVLRSEVIFEIRRRMIEMGFLEIHTPILTVSSPEGARDYLVPSRRYPGRFYALPQAPQQFKQLLMVAGFDRYFQIAPCFRDEDSRADRSPGEFYQLDLEMSFVEQDDVFAAVEQLFVGVFRKFSEWPVNDAPFPRIAYADSLLRYGTDKPDLRIGLELADASPVFAESNVTMFRRIVENGGVVRALAVPGVAGQPRSFFEKLETALKAEGAAGLGYLLYGDDGLKGPLARAVDEGLAERLATATRAERAGGLFFLAGDPAATTTLAGKLRVRVADELSLRRQDAFQFCWIVDFPMYERNEDTKQIEFSHNPFSMPQGGLEALETRPPLEILAHQYDLVCNGVELSSGAIRNHRPDIMYKAFEIAGYSREAVDERFGGMIRAFTSGAPPHGGIAPGIERIVMLLAGERNLREIIPFPMNQNAEDPMMGAPAPVSKAQLDELHIQVKLPPAPGGAATDSPKPLA